MRIHVKFRNMKQSFFLKGFARSKGQILKDLCAPPSRLDLEIEQRSGDNFTAVLEYRDSMSRFVTRSNKHSTAVQAINETIESIRLDLKGREMAFNDGFIVNSSFA